MGADKDIVERLNAAGNQRDWSDGATTPILIREAAAEIFRLRGEVAFAASVIGRYAVESAIRDEASATTAPAAQVQESEFVHGEYIRGFNDAIKATNPSACELGAQGRQAPLTDTYVQGVPDKCDRIIWRGSYYHLPVTHPDGDALGAVTPDPEKMSSDLYEWLVNLMPNGDALNAALVCDFAGAINFKRALTRWLTAALQHRGDSQEVGRG